MKAAYLLAILVMPVLVGCTGLVRQLPTPVPSTPVPTALPSATPSPIPTATPAPSATLTPETKKPSDVTPTTATGPRRIQFATGAITHTVHASLATNKVDYYVLRALGGQKMSVVATPTSGQQTVLLQISGADGNPLKSMAAGGLSWSGVLPSTQDYTIAISTPDGSPAAYTLDITIPPLGK